MRRTPFLVLAFVLSPFPCSRAIAQTADPVTIEIDATKSGQPVRPIWTYFGYDEANYTTHAQTRDVLSTLATSFETPVHVRTHFLFNTGDGTPSLKWGSTNIYTENEDGEPVYDFAIIDSIMDATLEAGTFPLFEIGFMPQALSIEPVPYENSATTVLDGGSYFPPKDYEKWAELVSTWARHAKQRYAGSQTNWIWELWNEPDIGYFNGTVEEYAKLYDYTEAALHAVLPDAPLGGPAIARVDDPFFDQFLEHCKSGVNAITGEPGTRLDYVSFHAKGGVTRVDEHVQMDLGYQLKLHRTGFEKVVSFGWGEVPVYVTEADPDGCAACPSSRFRYLDYRNSPAYAAYEIAMMKHSLQLADEVGVDLRALLTWAMTFPEAPYFAGYRALSTGGIALPVLNAFKLLAKLRGQSLSVKSDGALSLSELLENGVRQDPDIDALASIEGDRIQILVFNYHDDLVESPSTSVTLKVALPSHFEQRLVLSHLRVDENHGDAFSVWEKQGSPATPTDEQLAELHAAADGLVFEPDSIVTNHAGEVELSFELPRFGVSLLTLTSDPENSEIPPALEGEGCSCAMAPRPLPTPSLLMTMLGLVLGRLLSRRRE